MDTLGNPYITGNTQSTNFPTEMGALQTAHGGGQDIFVTKLDTSGSFLHYSTYLGGSDNDLGFDIAVDSSGGANAYITGFTRSIDFPTTGGSFQTAYGGGFWDAFVTKLNATGSGLDYSTFVGGSDTDQGTGIAVDMYDAWI